MNYLAHLILAEPTEDSRLGGLIGDFMSGRRLEEFSPGLQAGILRHRRIDKITDAHPVFRRTRVRLDPKVGRFSGVVADVVYDHFLAATWQRWHEGSLSGFAASVYAMLERRFDELPPRLQRAIPWLVGEDWLSRYGDLDHMRRVFEGLSRRIRRENPIRFAFDGMLEEYEGLGADFAAFFPELRAALTAPDRGTTGAMSPSLPDV